MANFYIENITVQGKDKADAVVRFSQGLNIIQGFSDTGKSCILKCIDYMFSSKTPPFDSSTGYTKISMKLISPDGEVVFTRTIGKNKINVVSSIDGIDSGNYDIAYKTKQKNPVINAVWFKLLGIDDEPSVIFNNRFEKKHLTWRTISKMLFITENDIDQPESIMLPKQVVEQTYYLSTLLYLISGRSFAETDAKTKKEIRTARRKAVEDYVNSQLGNIAKRKETVTASLAAYDGIDVESEMAKIISDIKETDAAITAAVNESRDLLGKIMFAEEKASECAVLLSRYSTLRSQYTADVRRLTFIVEGETKYNKIPRNVKCPFCDGKIENHNHQSYIEAAGAELSRIISQMDGLSETEADVQREQSEIEAELATLRAKRTDIETMITDQLRPHADSLQKALIGYRSYVNLQHELSIIASFADSWTSDLRELPSDEDDSIKYSPRDYFDDTFLATMDSYAMDILAECSYENLTSARFNLKDFDIEVNGGKKSTNHGKGFCAFLNTVVALMFRRYFANNAKYNPGILMIDTPILGLDQGIDNAAPESMRTSLFNYFINHQDEGQLIIVENLEHIPHLDYENAGATMITFTKGKMEGRYGFLDGIR